MVGIALSMAVFALVGAISPGPVNFIATGTGANFGFRRALPHVVGATLGYTIIVFAVGLGLDAVFTRWPALAGGLQYIGGAFLLYMAYKMATAAPMTPGRQGRRQPPSLWQGLLAQWLNPKAWLVSTSGVGLYVSAHSPALLYLLLFGLISFAACLLSVGSWAAFGHVIHQYLSTPRHQVRFNLVMGGLLATTVATMMISVTGG